ncbi:hypothetical protein [Aneurinibacillus aneurinilyticus]|uniref:hypothetical protein n=1 Tax=Aneurinibacillus aneurinilyticus TaxID=1391 RepID=UPI003523944A
MQEYTFKDLKKALQKKDISQLLKVLGTLYILNEESFKKGLLLSGCLPEPLARNFNKDNLLLFAKACMLTEENFRKFDNEMAEEFSKVYRKLVASIFVISEANNKNQKQLEDIDFLNYPFAKQIQMISTFIESQSIYARRENSKRFKNGYYTGLECEMPNGEQEVSIADNIEFTIEITDTLIRLLHFKHKDNIDTEDFKIHSDISPYNLPSIEKLFLLASHRLGLNSLWEKIKFQNWEFDIYKEKEKKMYYYRSPSEENLKIERAAILRYRYKEHIYTSKKFSKITELSKLTSQVRDDINISLDKPESIFTVKEDIYRRFEDLAGVFTDVEFEMLEEELGSTIESTKIGSKSDISLNELMLAIKYLKTLALIYQEKSHKVFNDENEKSFKYLAPILPISGFVSDFSSKFNIDATKAEEIIEQFIFSTTPTLDIFSQPLIYVGNGNVIFTPQLITQMNDNRIVGMHISKWNVNVAKKGIEFEQFIRNIFRLVPFLHVNSKPIKFTAYDGKEVEFDFIGTFEGALLLVEMKCLKRPFSSKEIKQREEDVMEGVNQVVRREKVVKKEWEKIKSIVDIPLPEQPPEKIIKIVCLNIFDFTGRQENGVIITDVSTFSKFFMNPEVKAHTNQSDNPANNKIFEVLWKTRRPTLEGFLDYLNKPVAMKGFYENLKESPRHLLLIDDKDTRIAFQDFVLQANPYTIEKVLPIEQVRKYKEPKQKKKKNKRYSKKNKSEYGLAH